MPLASSSLMRAVIATLSDGRGTGGEWVTSVIMGAMLLVRTELARPGVPLIPTLGSQFLPELLSRAGFTSSNELPKPPAAENQDQPENPSSTTHREIIFPVAGEAGVPLTVMVKVLGVTPFTVKRPLYSGWSAPEIITTS